MPSVAATAAVEGVSPTSGGGPLARFWPRRAAIASSIAKALVACSWRPPRCAWGGGGAGVRGVGSWRAFPV